MYTTCSTYSYYILVIRWSLLFIKYFVLKSFIHFSVSFLVSDIIIVLSWKEFPDRQHCLWYICSPSCLTFCWGFKISQDFQLSSWRHIAGHMRSHFLDWHQSEREFANVLCWQIQSGSGNCFHCIPKRNTMSLRVIGICGHTAFFIDENSKTLMGWLVGWLVGSMAYQPF